MPDGPLACEHTRAEQHAERELQHPGLRERARTLYGLMLYVPYLVAPLPWLLGDLSPWLLLPWLTLPLAIRLARTVRTHADGPTLNEALAQTGMLQLAFCVLLSAGVLAS